MEDDLLGQFFSDVRAVEEEVKRDGGEGAEGAASSSVPPGAGKATNAPADPGAEHGLEEESVASAETPRKRLKSEASAVVVATAQPAEVVVAAATRPTPSSNAADARSSMAAASGGSNGAAPARPAQPSAQASHSGSGTSMGRWPHRAPGNANAHQTLQAQAKKTLKRSAGGKTWEDPTLNEWPENDFRLFIGDLGADTSAGMLETIFRKYPSFAKAKICRDHARNKVRQFGFVSFLDGMDCMRAMREQQGKYCGQRPMKIRKSTWKDRDVGELKKKDRRKKHFQKKLGLG